MTSTIKNLTTAAGGCFDTHGKPEMFAIREGVDSSEALQNADTLMDQVYRVLERAADNNQSLSSIDIYPLLHVLASSRALVASVDNAIFNACNQEVMIKFGVSNHG